MAKMSRAKTGFTLIETVITVGLVGVLSVGIVNIFFSTVKGGGKARLEAEIKSQGDFAITSIERNLRNAIRMPECSGDLSFDIKNNSGQIETYTYSVTGNDLILAIDGVNKGLVTNSEINVESFDLNCVEGIGVNPGTVSVAMTLSINGEGGQTVRQTFQTRVSMRNQL